MPDTLSSFSPEQDSGRVNRPHTQLQVVDQAIENATRGVALVHQLRMAKGAPKHREHRDGSHRPMIPASNLTSE